MRVFSFFGGFEFFTPNQDLLKNCKKAPLKNLDEIFANQKKSKLNKGKYLY